MPCLLCILDFTGSIVLSGRASRLNSQMTIIGNYDNTKIVINVNVNVNICLHLGADRSDICRFGII